MVERLIAIAPIAPPGNCDAGGGYWRNNRASVSGFRNRASGEDQKWQRKTGKLHGRRAAMSEVWNAALAA